MSQYLLVVNKVLSQADGKDKLLRFIQFLMKLISYSVTSCKSSALTLEDALANSRKAFRIFRSLECLAKSQEIIAKLSKNNGILPWFELVQQGGYFSFFLVDHIFMLAKLSLVSFDTQLLRSYFGGTFLIGCLGGLGSNSTRLLEIQARYKDKLLSKRIQNVQLENIVDGVKNALDSVIGVNITWDKKYNDGMIGAFGASTSLIWLWQHYWTFVTGKTLAERLALPADGEEEEEDL